MATLYRFGSCTLDIGRCELRLRDDVVPVEPQVFALLKLLVENRERVVGRDEILERIWDGRVVSEAAVSSRVKSARRAIGDDGLAQAMIRTVRKHGFRFVAEVDVVDTTETSLGAPSRLDEAASVGPRTEEASRPSIAVLPFELLGGGGPHAGIADALPHDLIVELSRLRWLFVIARGSSFRFRGADAVPETVRAALRVRYCLSGSVEIEGGRMAVTVELADTRQGGVLWSERYRAEPDAVHEVRQEIVQAVTNAIELEIPASEARQARLKSPERLDAWSAYHLGLQQMYRFSREGNALAGSLFEQAIALDREFARAYAGLSFTHFENAFLGFAADRARAAEAARGCAEEGLARDPLDPFCNLVMGRVLWLRGDLEGSLPWLDRAIDLNRSYAQGRYSRAWASTILGAGLEGRAGVDAALDLSPLDPLAYGMLGVRAFSHIVLDEPAEAVHWAERAARAPGAHALIEMIAAVAHGLNGDEARGRAWAASARRRSPALAAAEFLRAFPFRDPALRRRIGAVLGRLSR